MYFEPRPLTKCLKADISIQGGPTFYCTPRTNLPNIQDYQEVEIAMFTKDGKWIDPSNSPVMTDFPQLQELLEHYEPGECPVGAYVPIEIVNALVNYLDGN